MFNIFDKNNPFVERAKSPLYGAFMVSWIIWNWKIFVTLFFFNKEDYWDLNVVNYIDKYYLNWWDTLVIPLVFALIYIFGLPYFDFYIFRFSEKKKRKKIDEKIKIGELHYVEGERYYKLQFDFLEEKDKVMKFEGRITDVKIENSKLQSQLKTEEQKLRDELIRHGETKNEKTKLQGKLDVLKKRNDLGTFFQGRWTRESRNNSQATEKEKNLPVEQIEIMGNDYYIFQNTNKQHVATIDFVDYDPDNRKLNFVKMYSRESRDVFCKLQIETNDIIEGNENNLKVTYTRHKFTPSIIDNIDIGPDVKVIQDNID